MYLHEVAMKTFVLLQAGWPVGKARQLIERLKPTHVIVHRTDPQDYYYLYTKLEALDRLAHWPDQMSIHEAFNLHEYVATPVLDAYANAETAPDRSVVIEDGRVIGFFDVTVPPPGTPRRGIEPRRNVARPRLPGDRPAAGNRPTGGAAGERDGRARRGASRPRSERSPAPPPPPPQMDKGIPELAGAGLVPRSLVADFPEQVRLADTVSLLVSLSAESVTGAALPLALPRRSRVDVVVQPKRGFVLEGTGEGSLVISDEEETLPLQFKLKATELGPGKVLVLAFHQGQPLGTITLAPTVVPATEAAAGQRRSHEQPMTPVSVHQPDLSLLILEHQSDGQPALTFRLTALDPSLGLNLKRFGPVLLRTNPLQYFQEFFQDIENLPLNTPQDKARAEQRLAAKGATLFETVIPEDLQVLLWSLRDRIRSVQVQSEEPWIPWELCKLQGRENGRMVEGPFLCEAFAITRWLPEIGFKPNTV